MDVFEAYQNQLVTLYLRNTTNSGDKLGTSYSEYAVFKQRQGLSRTTEKDTRTGDATLYLKPTSKFVADSGGDMTGCYAKIGSTYYSISSWSEGKDFDSGDVMHYRLDMDRKEMGVWAQDYTLT